MCGLYLIMLSIFQFKITKIGGTAVLLYCGFVQFSIKILKYNFLVTSKFQKLDVIS